MKRETKEKTSFSMSNVPLHRLSIVQNIATLPVDDDWDYLKNKYRELVTRVKLNQTVGIGIDADSKFQFLLEVVTSIVIPNRRNALQIVIERAQALEKDETLKEEEVKHQKSHRENVDLSVDIHSENLIAMSKDEVVGFLKNWLFKLVPNGEHPILRDADSSSPVHLLPDFLPFITALLPQDVRNDEEVVELLIRIEPLCLGFLDFASMKKPNFRVLSRGLVLRYANPSFTKDAIDLLKTVTFPNHDLYGVMMEEEEWLPANPPVLSTPYEVQEEVVKEANKEPTIDELMRDKGVVTQAVKMDGRVLRYMNENFRKDTNLRIIACKTDPNQALNILNDMLEDGVASRVIKNVSMLRSILLGRPFRVFENGETWKTMESSSGDTSGEETKKKIEESSVLLSEIIDHYSQRRSKDDEVTKDFSADELFFAERIVLLATQLQAKILRPGGLHSEVSRANFLSTKRKLEDLRGTDSSIGTIIEEHFAKVASVKRL